MFLMRRAILSRRKWDFFFSSQGINFGLNQFMPKLLRSLVPGQKSMCDLSGLTTGSNKDFAWLTLQEKAAFPTPDSEHRQCTAISIDNYSQELRIPWHAMLLSISLAPSTSIRYFHQNLCQKHF